MGFDDNDGNINENSVEDIVLRYRPELDKITPYLGWLKDNVKTDVATRYSNSDLKSIPFPVYNSNLLAFVKACQTTNLLDRNYVYVYSRNRTVAVSPSEMVAEEGVTVSCGSSSPP